IANALADLHHNGLLHRDLKSHNVLLSSTNYIKVADLGLARTYASQMTLGTGTLLWTAPEVLTRDSSYDYAADIYSFGVILTELSTLKVPFEGMSLSQWAIMDEVRKGTLRPEIGDNCPLWLRQLATDCMAQDPAQRPSAQKIVTLLDRQRRVEDTPSTPVPAKAATAATANAAAALSNGSNGSSTSNKSFSALSTTSLVSTAMVCPLCQNSHSIEAETCPDCGSPTPTPAMKLKGLLQRVAVAKKRGIDITTTLPCFVCNEPYPIMATVCEECEFDELPDDAEKLRLLVKIVERAAKAPMAG
ncbi:protein kinase, partial [Achlya hypogyna]